MNTSHFRTIVRSLLILTIAISCRNETEKNKEPEIQGDAAEHIAEDSGAPLPTLPYLAVFDEQTEQLKAEKNADFDSSALNVDALTQALVANYPEIKPEINRISNDTLYLHIADARYLTQQMGSSGAQMYIMEATYAYTELPSIRVVDFTFEEGDHALPGSYTRDSFNQRLQ
ncbi:hypothetical protein ACFQRK_17605 [Parapedobacter sp. GCM10030251]|jgi:hypothetical protein|uniref:hypothetical protein n=1 Tax=Parapedobacter sp. GCM10030251 TaxID=3273419 RepID=UPI0036144199